MPDISEIKKCSICGTPFESGSTECNVCKKQHGIDDFLFKMLTKDLDTISKMIDESVPTSSKDSIEDWLSGKDEINIENVLTGQTEIEPSFEPFVEVRIVEKEEELKTKEEELKTKEEKISELKSELEDLKTGLSEIIQKVKGDPKRIVDETVSLKSKLRQESKTREKLEKQLESLKKGSMAVIKYLKLRTAKEEEKEKKKEDVEIEEEREKIKDLETKLSEEIVVREQLENEVRALNDETIALRKLLEDKIREMPPDARELKKRELALLKKEKELLEKEDELEVYEKMLKEREDLGITGETAEIITKKIESELRQKELELREHKRSIIMRDKEIESLREQITFLETQLEELKSPMEYKEEELLRREEDLRYREQLLAEEAKRIEEEKKSVRDDTKMLDDDIKARFEDLEKRLAQKEAQIKAREKYLEVKGRELDLRAKGLVEVEIDLSREERILEMREEKVRTGNSRFDDLLFGGIPLGSNVLIYGPPFVGKEVFVNGFIAEGVRKGLPAIWILTNKSVDAKREEMESVTPNYKAYEMLGLIKYVDLYSKGVGDVKPEPNVVYLDPTVELTAIVDAVESFVKEFKDKNYEYYRLGFESISTLIVRLDPVSTFKFLQPFCGKRKNDNAVSMYTIEHGLHNDTDIATLGFIMDGEIDFKLEQNRTSLRIKGICEAQSREWISYAHTKKAIRIGSFALKHIR
jgi:KaiC/GvpD/RAD55 family RecA-like ATPase